MSVVVISMPLCSRHNAAVLDELSCCPSVGVWVSMGGWRDEGHVLLSSGNRWPHRVTSPHDQWHDHRVKNYRTLINLPRGFKQRGFNLTWYVTHELTVLTGRAFTIRSADRWRKHFCQCDCPVLWWWLTARPPCLPWPAVILRQEKTMIMSWQMLQYEHQNGPFTQVFLCCTQLKCNFFFTIMHHF